MPTQGRVAHHRHYKQMYREGVSITAIARFLDTMKIPTKQQGKGWHSNTVVKLLKREGVYLVLCEEHKAGMPWHIKS